MLRGARAADAVEMLELSSALLLSEALQQRDVDLVDLARRCGDDLPHRYWRASKSLERLAAATRSQVGSSAALTAEPPGGGGSGPGKPHTGANARRTFRW
jgi:hypothetical protein